jgi:nucleoid-associated protein YgaU
MGMLAFDRDAGVEVFPVEVMSGASNGSGAARDAALVDYLRSLGLDPSRVDLRVDSCMGIVHVRGLVEHQEQRERIVLCCGNVRGVAGVDDGMSVFTPSEKSRWRFVQPGDTFASIARDAYRDAAWARALRQANQPLIGDSDVLTPGWLLRIPAVEQLAGDPRP